MPRATTPPRPDDGESSGAPRTHSSMNDDEHAQRRRQLLEDLKVLSSMGLNKVLQLPQLVCIGSQSAGKSSLIETLCRITLPRSSGTCTRCPIECRSKYSNQPWSGRVFLRFESDTSESADGREIPFGNEMTNPDEMEKRIAQAQLAVLSPNQDPSFFLTVDPTKYKAAPGFTNSSVVVDISGEGQADLNFVDLPGLIVNVADGGEAGHIELVKDMVRSYISKENSIILLVVSCHTDYETQGAGILAAEFDPKGERTVGVLTKPDRIESTEEAAPWISMIMGKANRLANGWYSVKQPDTKQRKKNLTWDDARVLEQEFFRTNEAWSKIGPEYQVRLGSKNLAYQLGNILSIALEKRFAEIRLEIDRLIREVGTELKRYPNPPKMAPAEYIEELLADFFNDVRIRMNEGEPDAGMRGVIQTLRAQGLKFHGTIQEAAPVFVPTGNQIPGPDYFLSPDILQKLAIAAVQWTKGELEQWTRGRNKFTFDDVTEMSTGGIRRETSDFGPFNPTSMIMSKVVNEWEIDAIQLLDDALDRLKEELDDLVNKHFSAFHGGLRAQVWDLTQELLAECAEKAEEQIKLLTQMELPPRTFNNELFSQRMEVYKYYFRALEAEDPALTTMARVRTLYEIALRRYADAVPLTIDLHCVRAFGKRVHGRVIRGINLQRDEDELREMLKVSDPVLAQRDALEERARVLKAARARLAS